MGNTWAVPNTRSATRRSVAPLRLTRAELIDFSRFFAAEVGAGKYPYVDYDENERWHQRLYRDQRVDVWLISWLPTQGTQLHDHGGSSGAFTVLTGTLTEAVFSTGACHNCNRRSGDRVRRARGVVSDQPTSSIAAVVTSKTKPRTSSRCGNQRQVRTRSIDSRTAARTSVKPGTSHGGC